MKYVFLCLMLNFCFCATAVFVRAQETVSSICHQPFSERFDEFELINIDETLKRLETFAQKLKEETQSKGTIFIYESRKIKANQTNEAENIRNRIISLFSENYNLSNFAHFTISYGGYRENLEIELIFKPHNCSENLTATPTVGIEDLEVESFIAGKEAIIRTIEETTKSIITKTEVVCPAAAKAVKVRQGQVRVRVWIDEKGNVVVAKSIATGHPLIRAATANAVRQWKFQPAVIGNKALKVIGEILVDYPDCDLILD